MPENQPGFTQACTNIPPYTLLGGPENIKLLFDEELDDRREHRANARAWEDIKLRKAQNGASYDKAVDAIVALAIAAGQTATQTGQTENQQTVSPVRTATGDAIVGGVGVAAEQVAANIAQLATAIVPIIVAAGGVVSAQTVAAMLPLVIAAVNGAASKPAPAA